MWCLVVKDKSFKTHGSKGKELGKIKQKRCCSWVRRLNIAATLEGYECPIPGHYCSLPANGWNPACYTLFSLPGMELFPVCISILSKSKGERMEMLSLLGVCYDRFSGFCIHPWNVHGLQRWAGSVTALYEISICVPSLLVACIMWVTFMWVQHELSRSVSEIHSNF